MVMAGVLYEWNMWYDPIHQLLASGPVLPAVHITVYTCRVCSIFYIHVYFLHIFTSVSGLHVEFQFVVDVS